MGRNSKISWTDHTWNPWIGCKKVGAGCHNCYMFRQQERFGNDPNDIHRTAASTFEMPLKLPAGSKVFTCSWSDFFLEEADQWREDAWDVIRKTPDIAYQILTKRPERIAASLPADWHSIQQHVWLGVSAESERTFEKRVLESGFLDAFCAVKFISFEPLLCRIPEHQLNRTVDFDTLKKKVDWIIVGGESGAGAFPMKPEWADEIRRWCERTDTPFFFKQAGGTKNVNGAAGGDQLYGKTYKTFPQ